VERVGRSRVLLVSALFAAAGLALIAYVDSQVAAVAAVVLWGLGASLGFPLALSAAGDSGPNPAARVALASVIGYLAFLVGPPTLGFLGEEIGLRGALVVPLAVAFLAAVLSPATATRRPTAREQPAEAGARGGSAPSPSSCARGACWSCTVVAAVASTPCCPAAGSRRGSPCRTRSCGSCARRRGCAAVWAPCCRCRSSRSPRRSI